MPVACFPAVGESMERSLRHLCAVDQFHLIHPINTHPGVLFLSIMGFERSIKKQSGGLFFGRGGTVHHDV